MSHAEKHRVIFVQTDRGIGVSGLGRVQELLKDQRYKLDVMTPEEANELLEKEALNELQFVDAWNLSRDERKQLESKVKEIRAEIIWVTSIAAQKPELESDKYQVEVHGSAFTTVYAQTVENYLRQVLQIDLVQP